MGTDAESLNQPLGSTESHSLEARSCHSLCQFLCCQHCYVVKWKKGWEECCESPFEFWELVFAIFVLLVSWDIRVSSTLSDSSDAVFTDMLLMLPLTLPPPVALTLFCLMSPQSTCLFWRCFCLLSVAGPPAKIQALREQGHTRASVYSLLYGPWLEWWLAYGR